MFSELPPWALRQRWLVHRLRNLRRGAAECRRPEIALRARLLRGRVARARQRAARDFVQAYERELPAVAQCFTDSSLGGRAPPGICHELRENSAAHAGGCVVSRRSPGLTVEG
jgi:hypothetical protein